MQHRYFDRVSLLIILGNCITMLLVRCARMDATDDIQLAYLLQRRPAALQHSIRNRVASCAWALRHRNARSHTHVHCNRARTHARTRSRAWMHPQEDPLCDGFHEDGKPCDVACTRWVRCRPTQHTAQPTLCMHHAARLVRSPTGFVGRCAPRRHACHIRTRTGLTAATSALGGDVAHLLPHLRRDRAHPPATSAPGLTGLLGTTGHRRRFRRVRTAPTARSSSAQRPRCACSSPHLSTREYRAYGGAHSAHGIAWHGIPRGMIPRTGWYPARHGIPHGTVSHTARYPTRHDTRHGMVSRTARCS